MNPHNHLIKASLIVFGFWWALLNGWTLVTDPQRFLDFLPEIYDRLFLLVIGAIAGVSFAVWRIWYLRVVASGRLHGGQLNGIISSLGPVPILAPAAPRTRANNCLPIKSELVESWIAENKVSNPAYVDLFMAIWATLSAHPKLPASHRAGGHGARTLTKHCLAVAETALRLAPAWQYDGVWVKPAGKQKVKIIEKRNPEYRFDAKDPIIPIMALAHDLGKIEAYTLNPDGTVSTKETGTGQDDKGVVHDIISARMLARMNEYWKLPQHNDRHTLNMVVAHYHHPSDFPVDKDGLALDDRMTALMEFLILADKTTGMEESVITPTAVNASLTADDQNEVLYQAVVACLTEPGRINGTGERETDKFFKIGQKYNGKIFVRESLLLPLVAQKLGQHYANGDNRLLALNQILRILVDKGVLYTCHNDTDFSLFFPQYTVEFKQSKSDATIAIWHPSIVIDPSSGGVEMASLRSLPNLDVIARIEKPYFGHLGALSEPGLKKLKALVRKGFGGDVGSSVFDESEAGKKAQRPVEMLVDKIAGRVKPAEIDAAPSPVAANPALNSGEALRELSVVPHAVEQNQETAAGTSEAKPLEISHDVEPADDDLLAPGLTSTFDDPELVIPDDFAIEKVAAIPDPDPLATTEINDRNDRGADDSEVLVPKEHDSGISLPDTPVVRKRIIPKESQSTALVQLTDSSGANLKKFMSKALLAPPSKKKAAASDPRYAQALEYSTMQMIQSGKIPHLGKTNGCFYVARADIKARFPDADIDSIFPADKFKHLHLDAGDVLVIPDMVDG